MGHDHHHDEWDKTQPPPYLPDDPRWEADERLWQFKPIRVEVDADRFVGVSPSLPKGISVDPQGDGYLIHGAYGIDLFTNHRFVIRVDGELRTFQRVADIPEVIDNVVGFHPDDTHGHHADLHLREGRPDVHPLPLDPSRHGSVGSCPCRTPHPREQRRLECPP